MEASLIDAFCTYAAEVRSCVLEIRSSGGQLCKQADWDVTRVCYIFRISIFLSVYYTQILCGSLSTPPADAMSASRHDRPIAEAGERALGLT